MTGGKSWTKRAFSERRILSTGLIYLGVRDLLGSEHMRMEVLAHDDDRLINIMSLMDSYRERKSGLGK